jgi:hypothetical protein
MPLYTGLVIRNPVTYDHGQAYKNKDAQPEKILWGPADFLAADDQQARLIAIQKAELEPEDSTSEQVCIMVGVHYIYGNR